MDPERLTAYHEAGHAVAAELYGQKITRVEILGDIEHSGSTETLRLVADGDEAEPPGVVGSIEDRLRCALAGTVAESMVSGRDQWDESSEDLEAAVRLAMKVVDDCEDVVPLLDELRRNLEEIFRARWPVIEELAEELILRKSLSGAEVRRILGSRAGA